MWSERNNRRRLRRLDQLRRAGTERSGYTPVAVAVETQLTLHPHIQM